MSKWLTRRDVRITISPDYFKPFLHQEGQKLYLLTGKVRPEVETIKIDDIPTGAVAIKHRYAKALTSKTTAFEAGHLLAQKLPELVWKEAWPEIWRGWHNEIARHQLAKEVAEDREYGRSAIARLRNAYRSPSINDCAKWSIY